MFRQRLAFSLIELLIATAVIAILASVSVFYAGETRRKARDVNRKETVAQIATSLEQNYAAKRTYFVTLPGGNCVATLADDSGFMTGTSRSGDHDISDCVGFKGGGEGRLNAKNIANPGGGYYKSFSIADALVLNGYLARAALDPLTPDFAGVVAGRDFLVTLCKSDSSPATSAETATEYGVFAQLEVPSNAEGQAAKQRCGRSDTPNGDFKLQNVFNVTNQHQEVAAL